MKSSTHSFRKSIRIGLFSIALISISLTPAMSQNFASGFENADGDSALLAIAKTSDVVEKKSAKMVMPVFDTSKTYKDINAYMAEALAFPEDDITTGHSGLLKVQFQIQTNGQISHIQYLESPGVAFEKEVTEALMSAPLWTPAQKNSVPVQTTYQLHINFSLL